MFIQSCCVFLKIRLVNRVLPFVCYPFPSKERRRILERDDLRAFRAMGSRDRIGIPKPRERGSVIGADRRRSEHPEAVLPERALYLPTCSHLLIVNTLLSLSLSGLSLVLSLSAYLVQQLTLEKRAPVTDCRSPCPALHSSGGI